MGEREKKGWVSLWRLGGGRWGLTSLVKFDDEWCRGKMVLAKNGFGILGVGAICLESSIRQHYRWARDEKKTGLTLEKTTMLYLLFAKSAHPSSKII